LAASERWIISSTNTLLTSSTASGLRAGSREYKAYRYGGSVACSSSIAHWRCSRRLSRVSIRVVSGLFILSKTECPRRP
jgi:hypothetical protein